MFKFPWQNRQPKAKNRKGDMVIELARGELELDPSALPPGVQFKRCPKCRRIFDLKAIVCHVDSILLMLVQASDTDLENAITAERADGTSFDVLCTRSVGNGSLCEVYEGLDTATKQRYAVKILLSQLVWDTKSARRFVQGAKTALLLQHKNIVGVHGIGSVVTKKEKKRPFVVCDYIEGKQLSELIAKDSLPVQVILDIFEQICVALEYAHFHGVVHGDLKPTNICIIEGDTNGKSSDSLESIVVKVGDFAVAERLFRELEWDKVSTMTTSIYGCSTYLSPDFLDARLPTPVSDIYSVGCMMYECLTGSPPFTEGNDFAIMLAHRDTPPAPFSADYVPTQVAQLVMKALEKDPRKRWQSAAELRDAIAQAKEGVNLLN